MGGEERPDDEVDGFLGDVAAVLLVEVHLQRQLVRRPVGDCVELGFDGAGLGGAAGGAGGPLLINNQNTVVDQSSSNNIASAGSVFQGSANQAQVASGDEAYAAGDNIDITTTLDASTNITAGEDVLIDSTKNVDIAINSGNTYDFDYSYEDNSVDVDIADSFNSYSLDVDVDGSFNSESLTFDYTDVDVDVNAIVGSTGAVIGDIDLGL